MLFVIIVFAAAVVLALLGILLRKKLGRGWMYSFLAAGILLACCGGWFLRGALVQAQEQKESVYLSLRYLELRDSDIAAYYLKSAGSGNDYATAAAKYLLERSRGNDLTAQLNLDIAQSKAKSDEKTQFLQLLQSMDPNQQEQLSLAVERLITFLKLSEQRMETLDFYVQAEAGGLSSGAVPDGVNENVYQRLQISSLLASGSYERAVAAAVELADRKPSAENRLLLAETVAESAYNGLILEAGSFLDDRQDDPKEDASVEKEREKLEAQREKLEAELAEVEILAANAANEEDRLAMGERKLELSTQIQQLQTRADKLYVYRAFSAIADIHTVEAELVRARLYFALLDYEKAVDTLRSADSSIPARLTADQELRNDLRIVQSAYDGGDTFYESQEFRDAVIRLLSSPFSDLVRLSQTPLTQDFTQRIISDQKTYGQALFISGLDIEDYPTVRVTVSGQEDVLRQIVEKNGAAIRDTRQDVSYTARLQDGMMSNICVVVDVSGSMGGSPIANLKAALMEFAENIQEDSTVSLASFSDSARQLTELTQDRALLQSTVDSLQANGGTNITSGIRCGNEILSGTSGNRVMLLMTDGQSNIDFGVVSESADAGITIHTIGFGDVNDELLQQIADNTNGQYIKADSSAELGNVYASLQKIIGNMVTVEYTVDNDEITQQRYVFLNAGGSSVRRSYSLPTGQEAAQLYTCNPAVLSPGELQLLADRNGTQTLTFTGENLAGVASVSVGGQTAEINSQGADSLRVFVPASLSPGWQIVALQMEDGTEETFDRLLLVGESNTYRNIRLGSLEIMSGQGVLPGDGTLVLTGSSMELRENVSSDSTLFLYVNGTLVLPWTPAAEEAPANVEEPPAGEEEPPVGEEETPASEEETPADEEEAPPAEAPAVMRYDNLDLGGSGTITGWGIVSLGQSDGAYTSKAPAVVAKGGLALECQPDQSRLIQQEGDS